MEENNKKEELEVLDLTSEIKLNTKEDKKNNSLIIIIFIILVLFIIFLPKMTSFFKNFSFFNDKTTENNEYNKNLNNGFVQIGIDSYMTVSNIKFYDFQKKSNNSIEFNYISKSDIKNVDNMNLSIGIYSKTQELLATFKFNVSTINKSTVKTFRMNLTQAGFIKATYAKVIVTPSNSTNEKTTMSCVHDETINNVNLYYEVKYYFNDDKLYKYDVSKNILYAENEENNTLIEYKENLAAEYDSLSKTNISNIESEDLILKYSIDISSYDKKDSDYSLLYEKNTTKETILNNEQNDGWVCN